MGLFKTYSLEEIKKRHSKPIVVRNISKFRSIRGFDTETRKDGYVYLMASDNDSIGGDYSNKLSSYECFKFLLSHGRHSFNWFFNLQFDYDAMIKPALIKMKRGKKPSVSFYEEFRKTPVYYLNPDDTIEIPKVIGIMKGRKIYAKPENPHALRIKYIDKKHLSVSNGNKRAICYDVRNFLDGSLDSLAQKYLGKSKAQLGIDIDVEQPEKYNKELLINRCKTDAWLTKELGEFLMRKIEKTIGFIPRKWNSKASIAKEYLKKNLPPFVLRPFNYDSPIHQKVIEYAGKSYKGGIITLRKKGRIENIVEIDMKSAYPTTIFVNLPDLTKGYWKYVKFKETKNLPFSIGFYRVLMQFDGWTQYRLPDGRIIYPKTYGLMENYITRHELDYLKSRGIEVYVLDGYEWIPDLEAYYDNHEAMFPFKGIIENLAKLKNEAERDKDEGIRWLAKVILNSIYGVFAESKHGIGELFNDVYASLITTKTRINLLTLAFSLFKEEDIIEMHTDSIIAIADDNKLKEIENWIENMKRMVFHVPFKPLFEIKKNLPREGAVFIRSGITADFNGNFIRYRGMLREKELSKEFRVKYTIDEDGNLVLRTPFKKPFHTKESLVRNEPEKINVFVDTSKDFRINDFLLKWKEKPKSKEDLFSRAFEGEPHDKNFIAEVEGWVLKPLPLPLPLPLREL